MNCPEHVPAEDSRRPRSDWRGAVGEILLYAATFSADIVTGPDITVAPVYLIAVATSSWRHGLRWGIAAAVMTTLAWTAADAYSDRTYSNGFYLVENALARWVVLVLIAYGVSLYRQSLQIHRSRLQLMERLVFCCPACGRMKAVREGWFVPDDLFRENMKRINYCPECVRTHRE